MTKKIVVAVLFVAVALVAGVWLYQRSVAIASNDLAESEVELRQEFAVADAQQGMTRYLGGGTREALGDAIESAVSIALGGAQEGEVRAVSDLLGTRAELLFNPDYETWSAYIAQTEGVEPAVGVDETYVQMWEGSASAYANPKVDVDGIMIQRIDPDRAFPETQPGTICMRSSKDVRARYTPLDPASETREAMEVFVPVLIKDAGGKQLGATVSFVLGRSRPEEAWRELEIFVYLGPDSMGRELLFPPF